MPKPRKWTTLLGKPWGYLGPKGTDILTEPPVAKAPHRPPEWDEGDDRDDLDALLAKYEAMMREQVWGGIQPRPRYRPAFQRVLGGLEESRPYLDWFESMFPSLVREFETTLPTYKGYRAAEYAAEEAEKIGGSWADWLSGKRGELEERWASLGWRARGERPYALAPRIQTLGF